MFIGLDGVDVLLRTRAVSSEWVVSMTRKVLVACAWSVAMGALSGPAMAADGPYLALRGGAASPGTIDMGDVAEPHSTGSELAVAAGYRRGALRLEIEGAQRRASLSRDLPQLNTAQVIGAPPRANPTGTSRMRTLMVNLAGQASLWRTVYGFAGFGIGAAWLRAFDHRPYDGNVRWVDGGTRAFAWQVQAGAGAAITPRLSAELGYRHAAASSARFRSVYGQSIDGGQGWNSVTVGFVWAL